MKKRKPSSKPLPNEFKIVSNVPMPPKRRGQLKYPFSRMKIGDSFIVHKARSRVTRAAASMYGKQHKMKFASRTTPDGHVRIWRIK